MRCDLKNKLYNYLLHKSWEIHIKKSHTMRYLITLKYKKISILYFYLSIANMSTTKTASKRLENIKHHLSPNEHPHFESSKANDKSYISSLTDIVGNSAYSKKT